MRIAVCISGQLRQWKLAVENQKWFWETANRPEVEIDYFAHTWTYSWDREGASKEYISREVTEQEIEEFKNAYNLKDLLVDSRLQHEFRGNDHWSGLFYSFAKSILLKRKYELENNFQYDLVIKTRPDVVFNPKRTFYVPLLHNNCIYTTHGGPMAEEFNMYNLSDIVFLGTSYTMDMISNLYFYRQNGIQDYNIENKLNIHAMGPGTLMHEYFRDFGITPIFKDSFLQIILKEGCPTNLNLFDPGDFEVMFKYWQEWYTK